MTYQKPANMKYTDMAIFIDNNIYSDQFDQTKCFEYMYHIYSMLAYKLKLFSNANDYDLYAMYAASHLMMRYLHPQSVRTDKKIKSVLNYAKCSAYGLYVNFKNKYYQEQFAPSYVGEDFTNIIRNQLYTKARRDNYLYAAAETGLYFTHIPRVCKKIIADTPYKEGSKENKYLYISTMLTIISNISHTLNQRKRVALKEINNKVIRDNSQEYNKRKPILYHLPIHMSNMVSTLASKCMHVISKDIAYLIKSNELPDNLIYDILRPVDIFTGAEDEYDT